MISFSKNRTSQTDIAEYIQAACSVLKSPMLVILDRFSDRETIVVDCQGYGSKEKFIEIRFDTATLTCMLDNDNVCDGSYLSLDDLADLMGYIDYCNRTFTYDHSVKAWITGNTCIYVATYKNECLIILQHFDLKAKSET